MQMRLLCQLSSRRYEPLKGEFGHCRTRRLFAVIWREVPNRSHLGLAQVL